MENDLRKKQLKDRKKELLKPLAYDVVRVIPAPPDPEFGFSMSNYLKSICILDNQETAEQVAKKLNGELTDEQDADTKFVVEPIMGLTSSDEAIELITIDKKLSDISRKRIQQEEDGFFHRFPKL